MASWRRPKSPSATTGNRGEAGWRGRSSTSRPLLPRGSMARAVSSRRSVPTTTIPRWNSIFAGCSPLELAAPSCTSRSRAKARIRCSSGATARNSASPSQAPASAPAPPNTAASPSGSIWPVALLSRSASSGLRAARSCTHQIRSAGSLASRKGRLAVSPARMETGAGRVKATRPGRGGGPPRAAPPAGRAPRRPHCAGTPAPPSPPSAPAPGGGRYRPRPAPVPRCGPAAPAAAPGSAHTSPAEGRRVAGNQRSRTASQSTPERFSTTAQPCSRAWPCRPGSTSRQEGFHSGAPVTVAKPSRAVRSPRVSGDLDPPYIGGAGGGQGLRRPGEAGGQAGSAAALPRLRERQDAGRRRQQREAEPGLRPRRPRPAGRWRRRLDRMAAQRPEQAGAGLEIGRAERQAAEGLGFEVLRRQPHPATGPAGGVAQQQGFSTSSTSSTGTLKAIAAPAAAAGAFELHQPGIGQRDGADRRVCREGREGRSSRRRGGRRRGARQGTPAGCSGA